MVFSICVDDILLIGSNEANICTIKDYICKEFVAQDSHSLHYFIGIEFYYLLT